MRRYPSLAPTRDTEPAAKKPGPANNSVRGMRTTEQGTGGTVLSQPDFRTLPITKLQQEVVQRQVDGGAQANTDSAPAPPQTAPPQPEQLTAPGQGEQGATRVQNPPSLRYSVYAGDTLAEVDSVLPAESGSVEFDVSVRTTGDPITKTEVEVKQTMTLPKWAERDKQCPPVREAWDDCG